MLLAFQYCFAQQPQPICGADGQHYQANLHYDVWSTNLTLQQIDSLQSLAQQLFKQPITLTACYYGVDGGTEDQPNLFDLYQNQTKEKEFTNALSQPGIFILHNDGEMQGYAYNKNAFAYTAPNIDIQLQTILHELGHLFGLKDWYLCNGDYNVKCWRNVMSYNQWRDRLSIAQLDTVKTIVNAK